MIRSHGGFSALELITVVAIAGIAVAMVGESSAQLDRSVRFRLEVGKAVDALYAVRAQARTKGACVSLSISSNQWTAVSYSQPDCSAAPAGATEPVPTPSFASNLEFDPFDVGNPIVFDANGAPLIARPASMTIKSPNQTKLISIFPKSGFIKSGAVSSFAGTP